MVVRITIIDNRLPRWLRALIGVTGLVFGPIAFGVLLGSAAMQWAGFLFGLLILFVVATNDSKKNPTFSSIAEARAFLDRMERNGAPTP